MCYLVSSFPPASNGLRVHNIAIFEVLPDSDETKTPLERAKLEAERLLLAEHTDVKVWKLVDSPALARTVVWSDNQGDSTNV